MSGLVDKWRGLAPEKRQTYSKLFLVGAFVVGAMWIWGVQEEAKSNENAKDEKYKSLGLGEELFKEDVSASIQTTKTEMEETNNAQDIKIKEQETKIDMLTSLMDGLKEQMTSMADENLKPPTLQGIEETVEQNSPASFPSPPAPTFKNVPQSTHTDGEPSELESAPTIIGGIAHIMNEEPENTVEDQKKKGKRFYLPPSFMDAHLLTGLDASTVEGANAHPQPFMIRVQKPAVLPNAIKANLKGCFVVAHGFGALNSERVESRLVSLNCLSEDGQAIIDTKLKGYVADNDGKSGLKGHVVSKQGAHLARVFTAGVLGGFGNVAETSANTVTIAPSTGVATSVLNPQKMFQAGLGGGISEASKDLKKFYLDLAKQASPVIEVGPAKKVTVVVTEGVWLEIRENENS